MWCDLLPLAWHVNLPFECAFTIRLKVAYRRRHAMRVLAPSMVACLWWRWQWQGWLWQYAVANGVNAALVFYQIALHEQRFDEFCWGKKKDLSGKYCNSSLWATLFASEPCWGTPKMDIFNGRWCARRIHCTLNAKKTDDATIGVTTGVTVAVRHMRADQRRTCDELESSD